MIIFLKHSELYIIYYIMLDNNVKHKNKPRFQSRGMRHSSVITGLLTIDELGFVPFSTKHLTNRILSL